MFNSIKVALLSATIAGGSGGQMVAAALGWYNNAAYADLAAVADFNNNRYALPALSSELAPNTTFDDLTAVTRTVGVATLTSTAGRLRLTATDTAASRWSMPISCVVGALYTITGYVYGAGGSGGGISVSASAALASAVAFSTVTTTDRTDTLYFTATAATMYVGGATGTPTIGQITEWDNFTVKEVLLDGTKRSATFAEMFALTASSTTARTYDTGQAVGLGPELMSNGGFDNATGWNVGTAPWTISGGVATSAGSSDGLRTTDVATYVTGLNYSISFDVITGTVASIDVYLRSGTLGRIVTSQSGQRYTVTCQAGASASRAVEFYGAAGLVIDNVSVKRITGGIQSDLAANAPRFTYANGKRQLRLEADRTNIVTWSGDLTNAVWAKDNATVSVVGGVSQVLETSANAFHRISQTPTLTPNVIYTASFLVQKLGRRYLYIRGALDNATSTNKNVGFDLDTTSVTYQAAGYTGAIKALSGGLFYLSVTFTVDATGGGKIIQLGTSNASVTSDTIPSFAGDPAQGVVVIGMQCEVGAFASDYIPTGASSVNRAIETCRFSPLMEAIMQRTAASAVVRGQKIASVSGGARLLGGDGSNAIVRAAGSPSGVSAASDGASTLFAYPPGATAMSNDPFGVALGFDATGRTLVFHGGAPGTDANAIQSRSKAYLGRDDGGTSANYANGYYDALLIAPTRLSNARLQALAVAA